MQKNYTRGGFLIADCRFSFSRTAVSYSPDRRCFLSGIFNVDIIIKNDAIAQAFIRKKDIFTERKVFPYLKVEHLNPDVIEKVRKTVVIRNDSHPWKNMTYDEIMRSAGLYLHDYENNVDGLTLAAGLLFGRDDVIQDLCPTYWTDCLCRKVDVIRYDDREIVNTNLIDSVDLIMDFARKHTNDKFYLDEEKAHAPMQRPQPLHLSGSIQAFLSE